MVEKDTKAALIWIVNILNKHKVPFQIGGGFAALLYGSNRIIADIDIAIPEDKFEVILSDLKQYLIYGPTQYKDKEWDLLLMTLIYKGQEIDIAGALNKKYFDKQQQKWISFPTDFASSQMLDTYGIKIPVMAKEKLIAYKSMLGRDVDIIDIKNLKLGS